MKKFVFASALAIALAGSVAIAQDPTPAPTTAPAPAGMKHHKPGKMAAKMAAELNLTDEQKDKIKPILADRESKMEALAADTASTPQAKKQQQREIMKKFQADMAGVLTPEQLEKMKGMRKGHKGGAPANE